MEPAAPVSGRTSGANDKSDDDLINSIAAQASATDPLASPAGPSTPISTAPSVVRMDR